MGRPWIHPRSLFSKIFHGHVFGWTYECIRPNLQYVALAGREIIAIAVSVANPQSWGRGDRRGVGDGTVRKSVCDFL